MNWNRNVGRLPFPDQPAGLAGDGRIRQLRETIAAPVAGAGEDFRRLLHLALNEAEALAWQTQFPELVFPTLAEEKARELLQWNERQRHIRRRSEEMAFAA